MQPDELIDFHHLKLRKGMTQLELEDEVHTDLARATGEIWMQLLLVLYLISMLSIQCVQLVISATH